MIWNVMKTLADCPQLMLLFVFALKKIRQCILNVYLFICTVEDGVQKF